MCSMIPTTVQPHCDTFTEFLIVEEALHFFSGYQFQFGDRGYNICDSPHWKINAVNLRWSLMIGHSINGFSLHESFCSPLPYRRHQFISTSDIFLGTKWDMCGFFKAIFVCVVPSKTGEDCIIRTPHNPICNQAIEKVSSENKINT